MKNILMSIKPQYVAKILNGEKTIEIRKRFPSYYRGWVYIYCTHGNKLLDFRKENLDCGIVFGIGEKKSNNIVWSTPPILNGKVVARFYCDNVEEIECSGEVSAYFSTSSLSENELQRKSCLGYVELFNYLKPKCHWEGYIEDKIGYAIHISQLEIFDKPRALWEFKTPENAKRYKRDLEKAYDEDQKVLDRIYDGRAFEDECANAVQLTELSEGYYGLSRAPQSWQYIEEVE